MVGATGGPTVRSGDILSRVLDAVAMSRTRQWEALSTEEILAEVEDLDKQPPLIISRDPADWPPITDQIRTYLVKRGTTQVPLDFVFPRKGGAGRSCHHSYFRKTLVSGEIISRSWLV